MSKESFITESENAEPADVGDNQRTDDWCSENWSQLTQRLSRLAHPKHAQKMFGDEEGQLGIYLWGVAAAQGGECDRLIVALSALTRAKEQPPSTESKEADFIDFDREAAAFIDSIDSR